MVRQRGIFVIDDKPIKRYLALWTEIEWHQLCLRQSKKLFFAHGFMYLLWYTVPSSVSAILFVASF